MVENPQLECLPEHKGPALQTWQLIMHTAMEKTMQASPPAELQADPELSLKKLSITAGDLIPLPVVQEGNNPDNSTNGKGCEEKQQERKKSVTLSCSGNSIEDVHVDVGVAPWKKYAKYPENTYGLHLEIIDFYRHISPLPEEEVMRQDVVSRMHEVITRILPGAKVEVFGSFETCLYLPSSDIDLAVFGDWEKLPLFALKEGLTSSGVAELNSVMVLDKASVPIVKLRDKKSKVRVDISFNTDASVKSVAMIKSYLEKFPLLPYIFLTLKHFLVQRDLNEVFTGGISSYCLLLLTVSFFQFQRTRSYTNNQETDLGILLMEFLELYGRNLNYQRIGIKIKDGGSYINKDKLSTDLAKGEYPALLCIEDPVTLATDIGKSSYGILRVKEAFEYAFNVIDIALRTKYYFKVNPNSTYLSRILSVTQELFDYRRWVQRTYRSMVNIPRTLLPNTIYHQNVHPLQSNDGKPPLLPTPTIYSPTMQLPTPPFSPFTTTANGILFNQVGFITNSKIITHQPIHQQPLTHPMPQQQLPQQSLSSQGLAGQGLPGQGLPQPITHQQLSQQATQQQVMQQPIIVGNITTIPTCIQTKENLSTVNVDQLTNNYFSHLVNTNSVPCLPPIGYVVPHLVTSSQMEHIKLKQNPSYSLMKTKNNSNTEKVVSNQSVLRQQDLLKNRGNDNINVVYSRSYSPNNTRSYSPNNSRSYSPNNNRSYCPNNRSYSPKNLPKNDSKNNNMSFPSRTCNSTPPSVIEESNIEYMKDKCNVKGNFETINKDHTDSRKAANERLGLSIDNISRNFMSDECKSSGSPVNHAKDIDFNIEIVSSKKKSLINVEDDNSNQEQITNLCEDGIDVISISSSSSGHDE